MWEYGLKINRGKQIKASHQNYLHWNKNVNQMYVYYIKHVSAISMLLILNYLFDIYVQVYWYIRNSDLPQMIIYCYLKGHLENLQDTVWMHTKYHCMHVWAIYCGTWLRCDITATNKHMRTLKYVNSQPYF